MSNMPSAANHQGNVRGFHIVWKVVTVIVTVVHLIIVVILL